MSNSERKTQQKEALRSGILHAARSIALRDGWQAVTIRKIADEVAYTPPIVYEYFENKEAVLFEVAMDGFRSLRQELDDDLTAGKDAGQKLTDCAKKHWSFAKRNPELYKLMFGIETMPSLAAKRPQEVMAIGVIIKSAILEISPDLDAQELKELFFQWLCIVNGFVMMALIIYPQTEESDVWQPEQFLERANKRFIRSLT